MLSDLLARYGDETEVVDKIELVLLRKIAEAGHDSVEARTWSEFREANGGQEAIEQALEDAVAAWKEWMAEGDG